MKLTRSERAIGRRDLMRGTAGALFLAPLLRARRLQAQAASPRRLVLCFTPDSHPPEWWPEGEGAKFALRGPLLDFRGLEPHLLFLQRLDHAWTVDNHHEAGMAQLFTGAKFFNETQRYANGPSIDQLLLKETGLRGGTPLASIHVSAGGGGGSDKRHVISYSGPGQPMAHEESAARAFSTIFDGVSFGPARAAQQAPADPIRRALRRRMLQINTAELKRLERYLGASEREKLELHVDSLRELEQRMAESASPVPPRLGPSSDLLACQRVDVSGVMSDSRDAAITTRQARAMADLIVNAFSCDRTRVCDFGMSFSGGHHEGLLGLSQSWHDGVAHVSQTNDSIRVGPDAMTTREAFILFDRFWAGHVAYLARRLLEQKEGDGSMLDNTLIVWGVESGTNHSHGPSDMQYLLIGGRNLGIKTGQFLKFREPQSSNRLLTSILHAFGHEASGLGIEPDVGPLSGVL